MLEESNEEQTQQLVLATDQLSNALEVQKSKAGSLSDQFQGLEQEKKSQAEKIVLLENKVSSLRMNAMQDKLQLPCLMQVKKEMERKKSVLPVEEACKLKQFYAEIEALARKYFKGKHQKTHV